MALDDTTPADGDGQTTGTKVNQLAGYIRQLKTNLNAGKLQKIGNADGTSYVNVNDDDTISIYTNGIQVGKIYSNGIVEWTKQSAVEAKLSSDQSIPTATWTKLNMVSVYDLQSEYNNTLYRWICTIAGKYLVTVGQMISSLSDGDGYSLQVYKNGTGFRPRAQIRIGGAEVYPGISASAVIDLAVGDYLEVWVYQDTGASQTAKSGDGASWFSVTKII